MSRALIPSGAHIIFFHGSHILFLHRASNIENWPGHWCLPGGKVDEHELLREAAIRETHEEAGITVFPEDITEEYIINARYTNGTRIYYFGIITDWMGQPENREKEVHDEIAWFHIDELPALIVPHHREAMKIIKEKKYYHEYDAT